MTIRGKLGLLAAAPLLLALGLSALLANASARRHEMEAQIRHAWLLQTDVFELNLLTHEYVAAGGARTLAQWRQKYATLTRHLREFAAGRGDVSGALADLQSQASGLQVTFGALQENRARLTGPPGAAAAAAELEQRLLGQLVARTRAMMGGASGLHTAALGAATATERLVTRVVALAVLVSVLVMVLGVVLAGRAILHPLARLRQITAVVARGELSCRTGISRADEIGALARDFDHMTEQLQQVTASRDQLDREVAARRAAETRLHRVLTDLQRSNEELQQFAYVASHDLQEPLRGVAGCLQLLRDECLGKFGADADELIQHAIASATRMKRLINDLLSFSRVESQGRAFAPVPLAAALQAAESNLALASAESQAQITHGELPVVQADATQMVQLLQNLLGNAIKFRRDGVAPQVHVGAVRGTTGEWELTVADNGIGIEAKYFELIFVIFQRLHGRSQYEGTGIGLAVCKRIVERHGGRIWVTSRPGHGTTFHFTLPAAKETHDERPGSPAPD